MGRARTARTKPDAQPANRKLWRELILVAVAPVVLFLLASLLSYTPDDPGWSRSGSVTGQISNFGGTVGAWLSDLVFYFFGYVAYTLPFVLAGIVWVALFAADDRGAGFTPALRLVGLVGFLVCASGLVHIQMGAAPALPADSGGILGQLVGRSFSNLLGPFGANLFLLAAVLAAITLATGLSWLGLMDRLGQWAIAVWIWAGASVVRLREWRQARAAREVRGETRKVETARRARREPIRIEPPPAPVIEKSERAKREQQIPLFHTDPAGGLPPLSLLDDPKPQPKGYSEETLEALSRQIEFKLKDFRIDVEVVGAFPGPVITRFEMEPRRA